MNKGIDFGYKVLIFISSAVIVILIFHLIYLMYQFQFIIRPIAVSTCQDNGYEYGSWYKKYDRVIANCFKVVNGEFVDKEIIVEVK